MPDDADASVAGIRITHPGRVLYEDLGLTKVALARYYEAVAEWMLPELRERPLSLVRCPAGSGEGCFYQKRIDPRFPAEIERVSVELGGGGVYAAANSVEAIVGLVQMGVIELHAWGATTRDLERPDRMVLDLDPDPKMPWRCVMGAAHHARERLEDLGLESFVKTTGGKGLHVVVPLARRHDWPEVKEFSRSLATGMAADRPRDYTVTSSKRERSQRIYIDYLRNSKGATAIAPYSVRARPGAPVATPLHWDELGGRMKPEKYHVGNIARRMQGLHTDPWKALRRQGQTLTTAMKRKLGIET